MISDICFGLDFSELQLTYSRPPAGVRRKTSTMYFFKPSAEARLRIAKPHRKRWPMPQPVAQKASVPVDDHKVTDSYILKEVPCACGRLNRRYVWVGKKEKSTID